MGRGRGQRAWAAGEDRGQIGGKAWLHQQDPLQRAGDPDYNDIVAQGDPGLACEDPSGILQDPVVYELDYNVLRQTSRILLQR